MSNSIGLSVYLSTFDEQKPMLESLKNSNSYIFTSFHIQEEMDENYVPKAIQMCNWLKENGFQIIADVSPKTLKFFNQKSLLGFANNMKLDVLRLDYGFSEQEIIDISKAYKIAFNASTIDTNFADRLMSSNNKVYGIHNFYPRPETGLDDEFFSNINQRLASKGVEVMAFIPGDEKKRGPIFEGLPTLERHRNIPPYVAFLDLIVNYKIDGIFVGDVKLSSNQFALIRHYIRNKVIEIPSELLAPYYHLYDQVFTIRVDSPRRLMRLQESREYSCTGNRVEPENCIKRDRGMITMDNCLYHRYTGEIQLLRDEHPQDNRVNVIGKVHPDYLAILECIKNGCRIKFIK